MKHKRAVSVNYLIHKVKDGYGILTPFNGFSHSQFHNILAAILGVGVGVAGLYMSMRDGKIGKFSIPLISDQRVSPEVVHLVAGLQNLGNNCFLNVILQALASCSGILSFLQNILANDELVFEEKSETMPLTVALSSLLKDLCIVRDQKAVVNPQKVMLAMGLYLKSFNLTRQQDAAEAFLLLLSSLEEEILQSYVLHDNSLAGATSFPSRIYRQNTEGQNECKRWRQQIFGPFDGMTGSLLTCRSCSSMLSMDFEYFRCLPLSPVLDGNAQIMEGCTVVDCFKHFTAIELVDYHCGRCWHIAALKSLSHRTETDEAKIKVLGNCVKVDSCDCKSLFLQQDITWTGFSRAAKQLSIARCPKILCIHLQRASINGHGELIKLQGHISFPLFLDLSSFMQASRGVEQGTIEENIQITGKQQQYKLMPQLNHLTMQGDMKILPHIFRIVGENRLETLLGNKLRMPVYETPEHLPVETISGDNNGDRVLQGEMVGSDLHCAQSCSTFETGRDKKVLVGKIDGSSSRSCMYQLSSVVEHYGRPGSGHYAVYRRVASESSAGVSVGSMGIVNRQWVYVSDGEVSIVPEETVLAAEASLLFYERIIS